MNHRVFRHAQKLTTVFLYLKGLACGLLLTSR